MKKPRGRMPAKVLVRVFTVPADHFQTWYPIVQRAEKRLAEKAGAQ